MSKNSALTATTQAVLAAFVDYFDREQVPPTVEELTRLTGKVRGTVYHHLHILVTHGILAYKPGRNSPYRLSALDVDVTLSDPPRGVKAQFPARLYVGSEVGRLQGLLRKQTLTLQVTGVRPFGSLSAAGAAPEEAEDGAQLSSD